MTTKKITIIIVSLCTFIFVTICAVQFWKFYWDVLQDPMGPEFSTVQGNFVSGPTVSVVDDTYTITWSTANNYPNNEVLMKSSTSKYPDAGVGADTTYDATNNVYVHTSQFRLSNGKDSDIPEFSPGDYTYQIKSTAADGEHGIISPVLDLISKK